MGPVLHLLHEQSQVLRLRQHQTHCVRLNRGTRQAESMTWAACTSWPLPLNRTSSNRVRRAGSPLSEMSLRGGSHLDQLHVKPAIFKHCFKCRTLKSQVWVVASSLFSSWQRGLRPVWKLHLLLHLKESLNHQSVGWHQSNIRVRCPCANVLNRISFFFFLPSANGSSSPCSHRFGD